MKEASSTSSATQSFGGLGVTTIGFGTPSQSGPPVTSASVSSSNFFGSTASSSFNFLTSFEPKTNPSDKENENADQSSHITLPVGSGTQSSEILSATLQVKRKLKNALVASIETVPSVTESEVLHEADLNVIKKPRVD